MLTGSCLCGALTYKTSASAQSPTFCHCGQCRTQSGGIWASAHVPEAALEISGPVKWFEASAAARRGFCPECGSFMFWEGHGEGMTSFSLGSLDEPHDVHVAKHIFVAHKGGFYDIADGLPQQDN